MIQQKKSKALKIRRFLLWKQLFWFSYFNPHALTFDYFKHINYNQHNTVNLTFFKRPSYDLFWSTVKWDEHVESLYNFNAEYLNFQYFKDIRKILLKDKETSINFMNPQTPFLVFIYSYNNMFSKIYFERHFWFKNYSNENSLIVTLNLTLNFRKNQLFLQLRDFKKRDYCFASLGFFIKFFAKKKSLKKNKIMKFLLAKFIRKLFIIANVLSANLIVKGLPINLTEMLVFLNQPLRHKFIDPQDGNIIDELKNKNSIYCIYFNYVIFIKNKSFGFVRLRKKGRIKRKLVRKLIKRGKVTD